MLAHNGLTGERVLKLAHRIATDAQRRAPAGLGGKYEDLVSFLTLKAMEAVVRYDPSKIGPNYTMTSWLCDIMERRVTDFYRRKAEGFGDRRSGNDQRITLTAFDTDDGSAFEPDFSDLTISEQRLATWGEAAALCELELSDWLLVTLDKAAKAIRAAAPRPPAGQNGRV